METVNFQCGNCKNLMAVETGFLGQQVRCPHCQQVVLVPAPPPRDPEPAGGNQGASEPEPTPPAPDMDQPTPPVEVPPNFSFSRQAEEESILAGSKGTGEALFSSDSSAPVLEMPAESAFTNHPGVGAPDQAPTVIESSAGASEAGQAHINGSATDLVSSPHPLTIQTETSAFIPSEGEELKEPDLGPATDLPVETPGAELSRRLARRAKSESMLAAYLLIFLIPYAIFVTLVAGYFYWRMQQMPHPLEMLKDLGDNPPAKRGTSSVIDIIPPETNLPSKLQVALGQRIRIGDLEVMPEKVEQRRIVYCSENQHVQSQASENDALVLTLQLRNASDDVFFTPTDPFFDRQWKEDSGATKPYTFLEMGSQRFFGGPIKRSQRGKGALPREFIQGQENDNQVLKPAEKRTTVLSTDPGNRQILKTLGAYKGQLVWRVQLRRGLVEVGNREVSTTAVIGVVFQEQDIVHQLRAAIP
jgi:hypothetical protein